MLYNIIMSALEQRTRLLKMVQDRHPGYHPITSLADEANNPKNDVDLRVSCHKTVLRYIEPELKSVDISGALKSDSILRVILDDGSNDGNDELAFDKTIDHIEGATVTKLKLPNRS